MGFPALLAFRRLIFSGNPMKPIMCATLLALLAPAAAMAQEAMYTEAATMPSPHVSVLRPQVNYYRYGSEPDGDRQETERIDLTTSIQYGIARAWSLRMEVPLVMEDRDYKDGTDESDTGLEDLDAMVKWRVYKNDTGGVDTVRIALMGGVFFASGDDKDFSSQTINPHVGAVVTMVRGRHGFNQEFTYRLNTGQDDVDNTGGGKGPDDAFFYNTAYLYRIDPAKYTTESTGAWYVTAELNGLYETNGDNEIRFAPGIMFEGWEFAFELMAQLPFVSDLDERAELDFGVGFGFRWTF